MYEFDLEQCVWLIGVLVVYLGAVAFTCWLKLLFSQTEQKNPPFAVLLLLSPVVLVVLICMVVCHLLPE